MDKRIIESDFEKVKSWGRCDYIDNDLLLLDRISDAPIPSDPRRMNFIFIALCTRGRAQYLLDTRAQTITPGDVIIISERHVVDNFMASPDLEGLCMVVSVEFYAEIMRNVSEVSALFLFSRNHPVMSLAPREQQRFREYFLMIRERVGDTANHFRKDLVRTLLLAMFYDLSNVIYHSQQNEEQRQTRVDVIFTRFIKLVEENCKQERRVAWYAQQLCITPKYLSETVKTASKRTPNEWIDNYVTLELRVLLKNTSKSIKQIAQELHFPNQSFLGKFFKEHVGVSPTEYRRS